MIGITHVKTQHLITLPVELAVEDQNSQEMYIVHVKALYIPAVLMKFNLLSVFVRVFLWLLYMLLNVIKNLHNVVIDVRKIIIIINICLRIMELSDVYVNDNELEKFHQNYCRTHWPSQGMACEVKDCGSYPTLRKYIRHWHRIHKEHHDLLVCPRCTQIFEKLYFFTRHI